MAEVLGSVLTGVKVWGWISLFSCNEAFDANIAIQDKFTKFYGLICSKCNFLTSYWIVIFIIGGN